MIDFDKTRSSGKIGIILNSDNTIRDFDKNGVGCGIGLMKVTAKVLSKLYKELGKNKLWTLYYLKYGVKPLAVPKEIEWYEIDFPIDSIGAKTGLINIR